MVHKTFSSLKESLVSGKENLDNLLESLPILERIKNDIENNKNFPVLIYYLLQDGKEPMIDGYIGFVEDIILETVLPEGYVMTEWPRIFLDDKLISIPIKFKEEKYTRIELWENSKLMLSSPDKSICLLDGTSKVAYGWTEIDSIIRSINPNTNILKDIPLKNPKKEVNMLFPSNTILCKDCKNDSFNLSESEVGSLNIVCNRCGSVSTFGSGMDVKGVLSILQQSKSLR